MPSEQNDAQTDFEIGSHGSPSPHLNVCQGAPYTVVVSPPLLRRDQLEVSSCMLLLQTRTQSWFLQPWRPFLQSCWLLEFLERRQMRWAMLWWKKGSTNWRQRSARMNSRLLDNLAPLTSREFSSKQYICKTDSFHQFIVFDNSYKDLTDSGRRSDVASSWPGLENLKTNRSKTSSLTKIWQIFHGYNLKSGVASVHIQRNIWGVRRVRGWNPKL